MDSNGTGNAKSEICKILRCGRLADGIGCARGLCRTHYRRWQNHGSEFAVPKRARTYKGIRCELEGCDKPARTLNLCFRHYAELRRKTDGGKTIEKSRKAAQRILQWKQAQKESFAGRVMPNECEVCGGKEPNGKRLNFDHCHCSFLFRGWICGRCNRLLGAAKDSASLLRKLADYIDEF